MSDRTFVIALCPERLVWVASGTLMGGQCVQGDGSTPIEAENEVRRVARAFGENLRLQFRLEEAPSAAPPRARRLLRALSRPHRIRRWALTLHAVLVSVVYLSVWTTPAHGLLPIVLLPFYLPIYLPWLTIGAGADPLAEGGWVLAAGALWILLVGSSLDRRRLRRQSAAYCRLALEGRLGQTPRPGAGLGIKNQFQTYPRR